MKKYILLALIALTTTACSAKVEPAETNPTPHDTIQGEGLFSGKSGNILEAFRQAKAEGALGGLAVNPYLWRASLDALAFMPLAQTDSSGGVIITDWYSSAEKPAEQVKLTVYIYGTKLTPQALKVTMFKQTKTASGDWANAVASEETARQLEETILTNARVLRVKAQASE